MEITVGLQTMVLGILAALTLLTGLIFCWKNKDWSYMIPAVIIGAFIAFIAGVGIGAFEAQAAKGKIHAEKQAELVKLHDTMPEPWQLVFGFLNNQMNQGTRSMIVRRFTTEGFGAKPAPPITFEQHRYFTSNLNCNGMGWEECRKWRCWVAQETEPFAQFDLVAVVTPEEVFQHGECTCGAPLMIDGVCLSLRRKYGDNITTPYAKYYEEVGSQMPRRLHERRTDAIAMTEN